MSRISILLNVDTRPIQMEFTGLTKGPRSRDFISRAAIENKRRFFDGFDIEMVVHVDIHEPLSNEQYDVLHELCDCVVVRKHTKNYRGAEPFSGWNDVSYLQTFSMARGTHVAHFDGDMMAFAKDRSAVQWMLDEVDSERHKFVCNPSRNHPHPCHAPEYEGKFWASTRFLFCKRETLDFTILEHAIREPQWLYENYDRPPRECPWTEQFLGIMANYSVIYPKPELDSWMVFPWMRYVDGTIEKMDKLEYGAVADLIYKVGGDGIFWDGIDASMLDLKP